MSNNSDEKSDKVVANENKAINGKDAKQILKPINEESAESFVDNKACNILGELKNDSRRNINIHTSFPEDNFV